MKALAGCSGRYISEAPLVAVRAVSAGRTITTSSSRAQCVRRSVYGVYWGHEQRATGDGMRMRILKKDHLLRILGLRLHCCTPYYRPTEHDTDIVDD